MANVFQSGSVYIDTDGGVVTKPCKIAYIVFTPNSGGDSLILYDHATSANNQKLLLKGATAAHSHLFDFSAKPLNFTNGIYADIATSGTATLVLTSEGASL